MHLSSIASEYAVESSILRLFAYAVANTASDLHFNSKMIGQKLQIHCNVRARGGFMNWKYEGENAIHFQEKLFNLSGISSAGRSNIISTRFALSFPHDWALKNSLKPIHENRYDIDIRVQYQETHSGFTFVCRILDPQRAKRLNQMGLPYALLETIKSAITEPSGLILASGPTGSGKTTLLNAILSELNDGTRSIFTIENPVEYTLRGDGPITQIAVEGNVTFADGLRAALRSDPDVILVGEIRDKETMAIALQAAQTGHLVLSTIHANGACETITRVLDLCEDKVRDAVTVADTLKFVMAQRLLEVYESKPVERALSRDEVEWIQDNGLVAPKTIYETTSKQKVGRTALIEAVVIDYNIKREISKPVLSVEAIFKIASHQHQYETLLMSGIRAVESGTCRLSDCRTSLEGNHYAKANEPLRTNLMHRFELNFTQISAGIDHFYDQGISDHAETLNHILAAIELKVSHHEHDDHALPHITKVIPQHLISEITTDIADLLQHENYKKNPMPLAAVA
jgi:type II secretory ATPase GspE/PulE/Tfp pilus assembly ATPase PilB-like protein